MSDAAHAAGIFHAGPLPDGWTVTQAAAPAGWEHGHVAQFTGQIRGTAGTRRTLVSRLRDAYPVGSRDREIMIDTDDADALHVVTAHVFREDPNCRRLVFCAPAGDLEGIDFAERAGYRYVTDVDLVGAESVSLLVAEPESVLSRPNAVESHR